jgi:hypothetical protein
MKLYDLILLPALLMLVSCATSASNAFLTSLHDTALVNDAVVVTATAALQSGAISSTEATKILAITDGVNALLTAANAAYVAGNTALASTDLASATSKATQTQACLKSPPVSGCLP